MAVSVHHCAQRCALVWILLKIMAVGTGISQEMVSGKPLSPYYTILICVAGATNYRYYSGPETIPKDLETTGKVRAEIRTRHACNDEGSTAAITHRKRV